MAKLFDIRENIRSMYQKYGMYIRPLMKGILSFIILYVLSVIFGYDPRFNNIFVFVVLSVMQAFLPVSFVFYAGTALVALNLWSVSPEIMLIFLAVAAASWLAFIRVDQTCALLVILTPVLFFLKLEYFIPVLAGMIFGLGGILPVMGGILIYYIGIYTRDVSALLAATTGNDTGIALSRMIQLFTVNKTLMVILVAFCLVIFISAILYRMFHEKAWMYTVIIGNIALAFILLSGRLIFDLDYTIWRVLLECFLAAGAATIYQLFRGIGDAGRMEKVQFEDDEYIYYVKAVPKIRVAITERNVTRIKSKDEDDTSDKAGAAKEGDSADKAGAVKEDVAADKAGAAKEGDSADKTGAAKEGDSADKAGAAKKDDSADKAAAAKEGDSADKAAAAKEGDSGDKAGAAKEGVAADKAGAAKEGDAADKAGAAKEGDTADKAAAAQEDPITVEDAVTVEKIIVDEKTDAAEKAAAAGKKRASAKSGTAKRPVFVEKTAAKPESDRSKEGAGADADK